MKKLSHITLHDSTLDPDLDTAIRIAMATYVPEQSIRPRCDCGAFLRLGKRRGEKCDPCSSRRETELA